MPVVFWLWRLARFCLHKLRTTFRSWFPPKPLLRYGRRKPKQTKAFDDKKPVYYRTVPKPGWVKKEIIRLKALMPQEGCRKIADVFNRRFEARKKMTVGRTYVNYTIRKHQYDIQVLRRKLKHKIPRPIPKNLVWGMDLTGKTDTQGCLHNILGILEHKSRATLTLTALKDKTTITLIRYLLNAVERFGKPTMVRTDNEAVFTSRLFRFVLWLLGIRHQRIELHCPWQIGRIERLTCKDALMPQAQGCAGAAFGTLKEKLNLWEVDNKDQLNRALSQFTFWCHHVRPHQHLDGRTPAEVWNGKDIFATRPKKEYWFEAWEGLLRGYYLQI